MENYQSYLKRKQGQYGSQFDPSGLNPSFIPYFETGARIKVDYYGEELTGTVGVTTGWRPCFLLMRRKSDHGSSYTIGSDVKILAVQYGRTYHAV